MSTVTLLTKVYTDYQLKLVSKQLNSMFENLAVKADVLEATSRGWIQVSVSGEDEAVALRYLTEEFGLCPTSLDQVGKFSTIKGRITALNKNKNELHIDIGVFSPKTVDATIPLLDLQAQLVDGRKTAFKNIVDLYDFCENLPLTVKINSFNGNGGNVAASLSEKQRRQYENWTKSLLDRLIILGASLSEVELALRATYCDRDVIDIEPLGMFEHAVVCKLGTSAAGLIPKIGKRLKNTTFSVFNPRKILEFLDYSSAFLY